MLESTALDRLADLAGIDAEYRDAWGAVRRVPSATKQSLLAAMGFDVSSPDGVTTAIGKIEEEGWRACLPPVLVVQRRRRGAPVVPIVLPATHGGATFEWTLQEEMGPLRSGTARFMDLPLDDSRRVDGLTMERRLLQLPEGLPLGYHTFRVAMRPEAESAGAEDQGSTTLIVAPSRCYFPSALARDDKAWGVSVQLYALRSRRNWGIGDFTDLGQFVAFCDGLGAGAVGLNPLHALFPGRPANASPYGPSSRLFLDVLYIDVEDAPEFAICAAAQARVGDPRFQETLHDLRQAPMVDYPRVAEVKLVVLELLYGTFREMRLGEGRAGMESERGAEFRRFQRHGGQPLERFGVFEALSEHFGWSVAWRDWPEPYRDPDSPEVAAFADKNRDRVEYFHYLQWLADSQLRAVVERARSSGMIVGLYHDLALGSAGDGGEAWARQDIFTRGVAVGAPPDAWNNRGQNWGMPPPNPMAMRAEAYATLSGVLRANMSHGGALRIDHVMCLARLFWIPTNADPEAGAYVRYPLDEVLAVLCLESQRQRCVVIGEDLGTVPKGFRARMRRAAILSYRLLYFQRDKAGEFLPPKRYPKMAAAVVGTHDLATLAAFWTGRDLAVRDELGLYPSREQADEARRSRRHEKGALIRALKREGLLPQRAPDEPGDLDDEMILAVHRFLALTRGRIFMVHLEDVLGVTEQINLPGTVSEYPNWRRKMPVDIEDLPHVRPIQDLARDLRALRPAVRRKHR